MTSHLWIAVLAIVGLSAVLISVPLVAQQLGRRKRLDRKHKRLAYQRAWEWLFGRRLPRLTDQRKFDDTRPDD